MKDGGFFFLSYFCLIFCCLQGVSTFLFSCDGNIPQPVKLCIISTHLSLGVEKILYTQS